MADAVTPNYSWSYPTNNADADTWGITLNTTIIAIDAQMFTNAGLALQKANNLSDIANAGTARTNLGLGTAATQSNAFFLQTANNLSDVTAATARTNLGLGTAATQNTNTSGANVPLMNGVNTWSGAQGLPLASTYNGFRLAHVASGTGTTSGKISWGTAGPGGLAEGEIYLQYT